MSTTALDLGVVAASQPGSEGGGQPAEAGASESSPQIASVLVVAALIATLMGVTVGVSVRTYRRRVRAKRAVEPGPFLEEGRLEGVVPAGTQPGDSSWALPASSRKFQLLERPEGPSGVIDRPPERPGAATGSLPLCLGSQALSSLSDYASTESGLSNGFAGSSKPLDIYSVTSGDFTSP